MKHRHVLLIVVLAAAMFVSTAFAEEAVTEAEQAGAAEELLQTLFGEDGPLNDVLPEGTDIDSMIDTAKEEMEQADSELGQVFDTIYEMTQQEAGNFSTEELNEYAHDLLSQFMGEEDKLDFSSWDAYIEINDNFKAEEEQYILDRNADMMDQGDVQIISYYPVYTDDYEVDAVDITNLACMIQSNYKLDDENQLLFISGAEDLVLFKHQKDEEGTFAVVEATFAEDGENYTASIEKMCDEVGITLEDCFSEMDFAEAAVAYDLERYLNNNPDIKGIEYQGEIRTAEELDEIFYAAIEELYPAEEEALTEDSGSLE